MISIDEVNAYTLSVKFVTVEQVKTFATQAEKIIGNLVIETENNFKIDGRSLMGIFSLDLSKPVTVICDNENFRDIYDLCEEIKIIV